MHLRWVRSDSHRRTFESAQEESRLRVVSGYVVVYAHSRLPVAGCGWRHMSLWCIGAGHRGTSESRGCPGSTGGKLSTEGIFRCGGIEVSAWLGTERSGGSKFLSGPGG